MPAPDDKGDGDDDDDDDDDDAAVNAEDNWLAPELNTNADSFVRPGR